MSFADHVHTDEREKQIATLSGGDEMAVSPHYFIFSLTHPVAELLGQILAGHGTFEEAKVS